MEIYSMYMVRAKQKEYGSFKVTNATDHRPGTLTNRTNWYVEAYDEPAVKMGSGKEGKKRARTLAATLDAAGCHGLDALPPGLDGDEPEYPDKHSSDDWEAWASENGAVPVRIASGGKAAIAGYLKVVHRERESWIGRRLGVSESTVRQYLSDLREGRR